MKSIVIGYDGSEGGRDALYLARALRGNDSRLLVVTVLPDPFGPHLPRSDTRAQAEQFDGIRERARDVLGNEFEFREELGDGPTMLEAVATAERADLIAIGSTHRGLAGRVYPGTTAAHLFSSAPCPVAIAPRGYADREHMGLGLIGVGLIDTPEALAALRFASGLVQELGGELRLLTVAPVDRGLAGHLGPMEPIRADHKIFLEREIAALPDRVEAEPVLLEGDIAPEIAAHTPELDALVVGSRGYGPVRRVLLGSVAAELIRVSACPVIVAPRTAIGKRERSSSESGATPGSG